MWDILYIKRDFREWNAECVYADICVVSPNESEHIWLHQTDMKAIHDQQRCL